MQTVKLSSADSLNCKYSPKSGGNWAEISEMDPELCFVNPRRTSLKFIQFKSRSGKGNFSVLPFPPNKQKVNFRRRIFNVFYFY